MAASLVLDSPQWLAGLNPAQRQAVLTTEGPVLILAGVHWKRARLAQPK